jgi:hypothetical protein
MAPEQSLLGPPVEEKEMQPRTYSGDDNNGSFAPITPELHETESGFESADVGAEAAEEGAYRRKPGGVPEPPHRPLAERIRERAKE